MDPIYQEQVGTIFLGRMHLEDLLGLAWGGSAAAATGGDERGRRRDGAGGSAEAATRGDGRGRRGTGTGWPPQVKNRWEASRSAAAHCWLLSQVGSVKSTAAMGRIDVHSVIVTAAFSIRTIHAKLNDMALYGFEANELILPCCHIIACHRPIVS
ncbi:uncharacterized protein [Lolium perenne]|uniref:uncharacterized protein isoform X2 n=1 Tax=Lolium perenne TaxID=4522 RepID=UPI003A9907BF